MSYISIFNDDVLPKIQCQATEVEFQSDRIPDLDPIVDDDIRGLVFVCHDDSGKLLVRMAAGPTLGRTKGNLKGTLTRLLTDTKRYYMPNMEWYTKAHAEGTLRGWVLTLPHNSDKESLAVIAGEVSWRAYIAGFNVSSYYFRSTIFDENNGTTYVGGDRAFCYVLQHESSGVFYIESDENLVSRMKLHRNLLKTGKHWNQRLLSLYDPKREMRDWRWYIMGFGEPDEVREKELFLLDFFRDNELCANHY